MGRYKEAPSDFVCPYRDNCPHLDGFSTTYALLSIRTEQEDHDNGWRLHDEHYEELDALKAENERLAKEILTLKAQLTALHRKQFKANRKKPEPPSPTQRTKKRGPPMGHPPWTRKAPDHIDKIVEVPAPTICPHCQTEELTLLHEVDEHLQEDIILNPRTEVTLFRHQQATCSGCHRTVMAVGPGELPGHSIGPVARAVGIYLRYGLHIPYRGVTKIFADLFGLDFVPATAVNFDRQAARKGQPLYEDLKAKIRVAVVVHADESVWREDGHSGYIWFVGCPDLAVFHIADSRSGTEAIKLLGENFSGALVTDDYAGYNGVHPVYRQTCWAHLKRTAEDILQVLTLPDAAPAPMAIRFCKRLIAFARLMCRFGQQIKKGTLLITKARLLIPRVDKQLMDFASKPLDDPKAETLRVRITVKDRKCLFVFMTIPGVPPTNNHAEQSLRGMVIMRKISFGTRSKDGSIAHSVLPSLLITAERQGKSPLTFFHTLFTADTATAQAALYRAAINSS